MDRLHRILADLLVECPDRAVKLLACAPENVERLGSKGLQRIGRVA